MIVYLITNKLNGKKYVGKTTRSLEIRWNEHIRLSRRKKSSSLISRSIRKYGIENFEIEMIEKCNSEFSMNEAEKNWIARLGAFGNEGYNLTLGGEGTAGKITSQKTRKLLSDIAKSRPPISEETRRKISESNKGSNNAFYGKAWGRTGPLSEVAKKKISIARKGKKLSESHKRNISKGCSNLSGPNLGKVFSETERFRMSMSRNFPVMVFANREPLCTCFSIDDACKLFKNEHLSFRKISRIIKSEGSIGEFSFTRSRMNISNLKKLAKKE